MDPDFFDVEWAEVQKLFTVRDEMVHVFIEKHHDVLPLLRMMHTAVNRKFGTHVRGLVLEAAGMWGDGSGNELFVLIQCDLDADAAMELLDDFDQHWWSFAGQLGEWPIRLEAEYYAAV